MSLFSGCELSGTESISGAKVDCLSLPNLFDDGISGLWTGCHSPTFGILCEEKLNINEDKNKQQDILQTKSFLYDGKQTHLSLSLSPVSYTHLDVYKRQQN